MAQLKTIPFTAEVPVKEDGAYNFGAPISCTGLTVPDGGITFGSGVCFVPNGQDGKCYANDGSNFYFSGLGIVIGADSIYLTPEGNISAENKIKASSGFFCGMMVGVAGADTYLDVYGAFGHLQMDGRYKEENNGQTYFFSGDPSTGNVYYKQTS